MKLRSKILLILPIFFSHISYSLDKDLKYHNCDNLPCVRENIDDLNYKIVALLAIRMKYVYQAADIKIKNNLDTATDQERADAVISNVVKHAKEYDLPSEYVKKIFNIIVNDSTKLEQEKMNTKLKEHKN